MKQLFRVVGTLLLCMLFVGIHHPAIVSAAIAPFTRLVIDNTSPTNAWAKRMADLDGDGFMDMIVAGDTSQAVWYQYPNWTKRTIDASSNTESGSWVTDIVGDGYTDLIVGSSWYENPRRGGGLATGAWVKRTPFTGGAGSHDIRAGDLDGDGLIDVVMRGETASVVSIFKQVSKTSWTRRDIDPGVGRNGLALVDIDQDGFLDIVVSGVWMRNPGTISGTWVAHSFATWDAYTAIDVADMNGDGRPDLILSASETAGNLSWFENPANPVTATSWVEHAVDTGLSSSHSVYAVDMDLDGQLDIVASEYGGSGRLMIYYNNGGATSWTRQVLGTPSLHNVAIGDYDNDGDVDIFGVYAYGNSQTELWRNDIVSGPSSPTKVLVFHETLDFVHASIVDGMQMIKSIGALDNFLVDESTTPTSFTDANLAQYAAVVFLNPSGNDLLNTSQQGAFQRFIEKGHGFAGIHNATAIFWPSTPTFGAWYEQLTGASYVTEISPQPMTFQVLNHTHPSTQTLPNQWPLSTSDIYNFNINPKTNGVTVLVNLNDTTTSGGTMGSDHPVSWYHTYDGGRAWYTAAGGGQPEFHTPAFKSHVQGGIRYAIGARGGALPVPGSIALSVSTISVNESAGGVTLSVTRSGGNGAVSVNYATGDGSALSPGDYTQTSGLLSWADGDTANKTITVPIINDGVLEQNETFTVTLSNPGGGATLGSPSATTVTIIDSNNTPPVVATAAAATPSPVTGTTTGLSVLGGDDGGEAALTYTWSTTGAPPAAVAFSANGSNAAKNTTATFSKAGSYTLAATIADQNGQTVASTVSVVVSQTLTAISVVPSGMSVPTGATQTFIATANDQFASPMSSQPAMTWTVGGGGTINSSGAFTAGGTTGGPFVVTASSGGVNGTANVTVVAAGPIQIGQTAVLSGTGSGDANVLMGIQATLGQSATIQSVSVNLKAVSGHVTLSVYADANNYPGALKAQTASFTPVAGWNTQNVTTPVLLPAGNYWIVWQTDNANMKIAYATGGTSIVHSFTYAAPPATFPSGGGANVNLSLYATLLPGGSNAAPTVATAAAATPSPVSAKTTALSVLGADDGGEAALKYTWATTGAPPAAVLFSVNGTNAAKNSVATFSKAGTYTFQVTITDAGNLSVTSNVAVTVAQTLTTITVAPGSATIATGTTQQFTASSVDQFGAAMAPPPAFTWSVTGDGSISASGLYTAGSAGGPFTVQAANGSITGQASVTVTQPNAAPTVATGAAATPSPVLAKTTALSALGADDGGEAALKYTWATTGAPPAAVLFSVNGTNAAKNTVATFSKAGTYTFQVTVTDAGNLSVTSSVGVTVTQTLTTITVAPNSATIATGGTQQFTASSVDQFGAAMAPPPIFTWSVTGDGSISASGLYTAGSAGGPYTVTAANGGVTGQASVTVTQPNAAPTVATGAAATPSPVSAKTTALSALGADDGGEAALKYTWATTGAPPAAVLFSVNGTNAAKNTVATFSKAGDYTFQVTITDAGNLSVISNVAVTVVQTLTTITVAPNSATIATGGTQQFTASSVDQFGAAMAPPPTFTWSVTGDGSISASGLYTAGSAGGPYTVTAANGGVTGQASVTVTQPNAAPTVATGAAATPSPVSAKTTALSALGADDGGEAALKYTWATTGAPPAAVLFSVNGTNAAKNTVATFSKAGSYTFQVTITDAGNLSVTSSVGVTVTQTLTTVTVAPASATVATGGTQQFTASGVDQFGAAMAPPPAFTWSVTGGGSISASGLFTAGAAAGGPFAVSATSGAVSGTASVTVSAATAVTLGTTSTLSGTSSGDAAVLLAYKVSLAQPATLQSLSVYTKKTGGTAYLGLYSDSAGYPGALKASTAQFTPTSGWNARPVTTPVLLPAGTYWLVLESSSNNYGTGYDTQGAAGSSINRATTYGPVPSTFPSGGSAYTYRLALYATLLP